MKNSQKTVSKQEAMSNLPLEVITDILSRLPVKSLMKFKCVCKPWYSLISTPEFSKIQLKRVLQESNDLHHHNRLLISGLPFLSVDPEGCCDGKKSAEQAQLCFPSRMEDVETELNILITQLRFNSELPERDIDFVGSCNGLVCALFDSRQFLVLNPSTREVRELPVLDFSLDDSNVFYGFGYDSHLDDYKLIVGVGGDKVEIFTLKSNVWRTIQGLLLAIDLSGPGCFSNGVLHWLVKQDRGAKLTNVMVPFDLAVEKFLPFMPLPNHINHDNLSSTVKVIRNSLCVLTEFYAPNFEAWVMEEYGNNGSWTKMVSFKSDALPPCEFALELLWVTENGQILLNRDGWFLVVCDPREGRTKQIWIPNEWDCCNSTTYLESLVSPICLMGATETD